MQPDDNDGRPSISRSLSRRFSALPIIRRLRHSLSFKRPLSSVQPPKKSGIVIRRDPDFDFSYYDEPETEAERCPPQLPMIVDAWLALSEEEADPGLSKVDSDRTITSEFEGDADGEEVGYTRLFGSFGYFDDNDLSGRGKSKLVGNDDIPINEDGLGEEELCTHGLGRVNCFVPKPDKGPLVIRTPTSSPSSNRFSTIPGEIINLILELLDLEIDRQCLRIASRRFFHVVEHVKLDSFDFMEPRMEYLRRLYRSLPDKEKERKKVCNVCRKIVKVKVFGQERACVRCTEWFECSRP